MTPSAELPRVGLAALLAAAAVFPAGYLLWIALPQVTHGGWFLHFASTSLWHQAATSFWVACEASATAFTFGALPAVMVSRFEFRGRTLVTALVLLPVLFAPSVAASSWAVAFSAEFFVSRHALALQLGLSSAPYVYIVFCVAAARMPRAFGETAAAFGLGPIRRMLRVHLPAYAVPAAAGLMIVFAQSVGDYATAERLGIGTLSRGIHDLWLASQSTQVAAIVSTVLTVPALVLVVVAVWASTSIINQNPIPPAAAAASRRALPGLAAGALVALSLVGALAGFAVPEALMLRWAWLQWDRTRFTAIPSDLYNSAATAAATTALVFATCALAALLLRAGHRSRTVERVPWLFLLNFFLPSLVLALAFVIVSRDGSPLAAMLGDWRDSRLLIVVPEALRFMPFAMLPALDALRRTPPAMIEAARAFGAGPVRSRAVAFAGHLWPALSLGCALVFIESVKEIDISLTLQPFGYSTLALKTYAFSRHQNMDRAAVWVLLSQALILLPLALLWRRMHRLGARRVS